MDRNYPVPDSKMTQISTPLDVWGKAQAPSQPIRAKETADISSRGAILINVKVLVVLMCNTDHAKATCAMKLLTYRTFMRYVSVGSAENSIRFTMTNR